MPVVDGQAVSAAVTNPAFLDAQDDDTAAGKISFANTSPESGSTITNIQKNINSIASFSGWAINSTITATPSWSNTNRGTSGDNLQERIEALDAAFNQTGGAGIGHTHDGTTGNGPQLDAGVSLTNINNYYSDYQHFSKSTVSGASVDISSDMSGKQPSGGIANEGVATSAPNNRCELRAQSSGSEFLDATGAMVYGRITYSSPTWTLTFYSFSLGSESPYTFSSPVDMDIYFIEVFNQQTRPTFGSNVGNIVSLNTTADVQDATQSLSGKVNITTQTFGGLKTFRDLIKLSDVNTPSFGVTLRTLSTTTMTADRNLVFDVNNAARAIHFTGGSITVTADANIEGTNTGDVSFNNVGSVPNANAASITGQTIVLQPADGSNPGVISTTTQTIPGSKTFAAAAIFNKQISTLESVDSTTTGSNASVSTPTVSYIKFTNGSLVSINNIGAGTDGQILVITNGTGASITLVNDSGGTATNRIITGAGSDMTVGNNASADLIYDNNSTRWRVIGGTGGGGGFTNPMTNQGDIIYGGSAGAATRFGAGTAGQTLKTTSTVPVYTTPSPSAVENYSLAASVSSNAMTIALKDSAGNDPSATSPVYIVFRNATAATGTDSIVAVTGALSVVIPSGATMGTTNNVEAKFNVGILNNAGTAELVVSGLDATTTDGRISSTTIDTASDTSNTFYSTTGRSNVAYKLLGAIVNTQSTAGTYATAPSAILLKGCGIDYMTASSSWTSYTPTFSWTANITSSAGRWRRVGDSMEIMMGMTLSGAPTSATLTATIPSGYTIDTAKQANTTQFSQGFGVMQMLDAGVKSWNGLVVYNSTTTMSFTSANSSDGSVDQSRPFTWGNGDAWGCCFTVPIVGWFAKDWQ